jgi:hypothetical protein
MVESVTGDVEVVLQTVLVDGRTRRAACKQTKVRPDVCLLNGEDPTAYVLSVNVHRRHMTMGQGAMAVALVRPEGARRGRGKKGTTSGEFSGVAQQRLSDARAVLAYSPKLAEAVMSGDKPLKVALAETRQGQGDVLNARSRLAKLRDDRPDLAELVVNEALSLDGAVAKARDDAETLKQRRLAATMSIIDGLRPFDHAPERAVDEIAFYDPALAESRGERVTPARLRRVAEYARSLADALENLE